MLSSGTSSAADLKTTTYYYTDPLGSVLATTDARSATTSIVDYRPYGLQTSGAAVTDLGFAGHIRDDDTGLVYMQARYYDADTARFISIDPTSGSAGNYFKFNRYMYVSGNPYYAMDPDGRDEDCSFACRQLRALSDYTSGIGQGLNDSSQGRGAPLGDMTTSDRVVTAQAYQNISDAADAASTVADPIVSALPGGDAITCAIDSCGTAGWLIAGIGVVPGEGTAATEARLEFSQARNAALKWLEARGFKATVPVWNRLPAATRGERIIGYATDASSARIGYRIEWDTKNAAHINTFTRTEKEHFLFHGDQNTVKSLTDPFNR